MTSSKTTGPTGLMLVGLLLLAVVIPPVGLLIGLVGLTVAAIRNDRRGALVFGAMALIAVVAAMLVQQLITSG